jgi:HPr kinase/phosphorylase
MTQPLLLEGVTAQQIFDDNVSDLKLSWIGGLEGADRTFPSEAVFRFLVSRRLTITQR